MDLDLRLGVLRVGVRRGARRLVWGRGGQSSGHPRATRGGATIDFAEGGAVPSFAESDAIMVFAEGGAIMTFAEGGAIIVSRAAGGDEGHGRAAGGGRGTWPRRRRRA